jgi:hypothetical protein
MSKTKKQLKTELVELYAKLKGGPVENVNFDEVPTYHEEVPWWLSEALADFPDSPTEGIFPFTRVISGEAVLEDDEVTDPREVVTTHRLRCDDLFRFMEERVKGYANASSLSSVWIVWDDDNGSAQLCSFSKSTQEDLQFMIEQLGETVASVTAEEKEAAQRKTSLGKHLLSSLTEQLLEKFGIEGTTKKLRELLSKK